MRIFLNLILLFITSIFSCESKIQKPNEKDLIFHAGPSTGGVVGQVYFQLFTDSRYYICNSGGIGEDCYTGIYELHNDTIILENLDKGSSLKFNRLIIYRYYNQDSNYWKWKYPHLSWEWWELKRRDSILESTGDVYQINNKNNIEKNETFFNIRFDRLKK